MLAPEVVVLASEFFASEPVVFASELVVSASELHIGRHTGMGDYHRVSAGNSRSGLGESTCPTALGEIHRRPLG